MSNDPSHKLPLRILLVDDEEVHAKLVIRELEESPFPIQVEYVASGQAALDFLDHRGPYLDLPSTPCPDLVLLDLRMPGIDGLAVLQKIKAAPDLVDIPVVLLSASNAVADIEAAFKRGANGYLAKPLAFDGFMELLNEIGIGPKRTAPAEPSLRRRDGPC